MRLPNLLPPESRNSYAIYLGLLYAKRFLALQLALLVVLLAVVSALYYFSEKELAILNAAHAELEVKQTDINIDELQEAANRETDRLKAATDILKIKPELSVYLDELMLALPANVTLDYVEIDAVTLNMDVKGRAASRDQIVLLQSRLERSSVLEVVYAPLSNLTESADAPFYFILQRKK